MWWSPSEHGKSTHITMLGCLISSAPRFLSSCRGPRGCLPAALHLLPDPLRKVILRLALTVLRLSMCVAKAKAAWHYALLRPRIVGLREGRTRP